MGLSKAVCCFAMLVVPISICTAADEEKFSTDWITPPLELSNAHRDVCAIDLTISRRADGWSGTITLYSGKPAYNAFGDASKKQLQSTTLAVEFRESNSEQSPSKMAFMLAPRRQLNSVRYVQEVNAKLALLELVLNFELPFESRLLFKKADGVIQRVLSLQSERLRQQANRNQMSDQLVMSLESDLFIGNQDRFNIIQIAGNANELRLMWNVNHFGLDNLGEVVHSTMMAFMPQTLQLTDLQLPDPSGQKRRVFICESKPDARFRVASLQSDSETGESQFLILDPYESGWHRLILMKKGQVERIIPLHSTRFRSWIELKHQITDAREKAVFDEMSKELPLFSGLKVENKRVVGAVLHLSDENQHALEHVVDFPHLTNLEIHGNLKEGASIEKLAKLESIRIYSGAITEEVLQHVGRNTNLKQIYLHSVQLDCRGLKHLAGLRELTHFGYWNSDSREIAQNFDDSCVDVFSALPKLQYLNVHAMPLTSGAVERLPNSSELTNVEFSHNAPIKAVIQFAAANAKANIEIGGSRFCLAEGTLRLPYSATDDDLAELTNVPDLSSLHLDSAKLITDKGLANLASLKLKEFSLTHNRNITDAGLNHLAKIETLESLNFWCCESLTNNAVNTLKQLPSLRKINFWGTQIDRNFFAQEIPNCTVEQ